eukprot:5463483-Lingulodinium_polyedra.AAC.1
MLARTALHHALHVAAHALGRCEQLLRLVRWPALSCTVAQMRIDAAGVLYLFRFVGLCSRAVVRRFRFAMTVDS